MTNPPTSYTTSWDTTSRGAARTAKCARRGRRRMWAAFRTDGMVSWVDFPGLKTCPCCGEPSPYPALRAKSVHVHPTMLIVG